MKNILFLLLVLVNTTAFAQVDSGKMRVRVIMQARDWGYLVGSDKFNFKNADYDQPWDSLKAIQRRVNPQGTTNVTIDSLTMRSLLYILYEIGNGTHRVNRKHYDRIETALLAATGIGVIWLTRRINEMNAVETADDVLIMLKGQNRARAVPD